MGVQEGPDKLAADVFEAEFEVSVLVDSVMAAKKSGGADSHPLLFGDFFRTDQPWRVTGSRCGDGGIERMREMIAKGDARRGGFYLRFERSVVDGESRVAMIAVRHCTRFLWSRWCRCG